MKPTLGSLENVIFFLGPARNLLTPLVIFQTDEGKAKTSRGAGLVDREIEYGICRSTLMLQTG
jgi:hypothetical protein